MSFQKDILKIVKEVIYKDSYNIDDLINHLVIDKDDEILLIAKGLFLRISIRENNLILEDILFDISLKNKGFCFKLIGKLIKYCESNNFDNFIVESIISNKLDNICKSYNMKKDYNCIYGDIDFTLYDFDGFLGRRIFAIKKEC